MKETLEKAAKRVYPNQEADSLYGYVKLLEQEAFEKGAKWQQERSYSDMREYSEYSMECLVLGKDCLFAKEWFEQFKKK